MGAKSGTLQYQECACHSMYMRTSLCVEAPLMYMENIVHTVCVLITVVTDRHTKHIRDSQMQALWRLPQ